MVVALLALCLAVGGTAFAATKLGKNAVKTKNIKNGAGTRVECPSAEDSPNAILVIIWGNSGSPDLVDSGFLAAALP